MTQKVGLEISARGGRRAAKELGLVDKGLKTTGRSARGATSALRGLMPAIGGAMIAAKAKDVLAFTDALGVIQGMAGITTRDARALGDEILAVGEKHGLARDEILGAIKVFQDNGGYLKEGRAMLSDLGMAAAATGTDIKDLAVISSKLIEQGFTPSAAFGVIETLNAQANQATVSLKDVGRVVSELISAGGAYGKAFSGAEGVKGLGELLQVGVRARQRRAGQDWIPCCAPRPRWQGGHAQQEVRRGYLLRQGEKERPVHAGHHDGHRQGHGRGHRRQEGAE